MKRLLILLVLLTPLTLWAQYEDVKEKKQATNRPYEEIISAEGEAAKGKLFNFGWHFQLGNPAGAEKNDFDDSAWQHIDLPHDFQFHQPWDEQAGGARGFKAPCEGWYRKSFFAPSEWQGLHVLLDFEGLMYYGDVYINGTEVASSEYGYLGFEADLSRYLNYGGENTVAVYANSGKPKASRWYTGAGLFRDVRMRLQNPTHINRHGIYVTTPSISNSEATVRVQVDVVGFPHGSAPQPVTTVRATVKDNTGRIIGSTETEMQSLTKHQHDEILLPDIRITNPTRWDIDNPYLYYVDVDVYVDTLHVDHQTERFGIRTIEYGKEFGFKLNGRKLFLRGIANHHDLGALGAASFDDAIRRQFAQLKQFGFNSIRCSHNPYSPSFTRIADEMGLLIVDELIDKWSDDEYWGGRKPFTQLWPALITEWITRDRNCPSVVLWSLGNELQIRENWSGYNTNDWGITTYRLFDVMVKRYDATRPTTVAMFPARAGAIREEKEFKTYNRPPELALATEISSFNYQWDRYPYYFEYAPDMILYQSEAVTNQMQAPFYGMDRKRTIGLAYWGAIEYWGESNKWPKKGWNYAFFRHALWPNPQAYLIKGAFIPEEPVVHIGVLTGAENLSWNAVNVGQKTYVDTWNFPDDSQQQVSVFTNCEEIELFIEDKGQKSKDKTRSLGRLKNDTSDVFKRGILKWDKVPYGKGGSLTAVAYNGGHEVVRHRIETAGPAVRLVIEEEANSKKLTANGMSLQYLTVRAVDKKGRTVPSFDEELTVEVEGGATLQAIDNGDHYTDYLFRPTDNTKRMQQGKMLVILRSKREIAPVTVRVKSPSFSTKLRL